MPFSDDVRMALGEAYVRSALQVDASLHRPLAVWAVDQAASHFYAANALDSFAVLEEEIKHRSAPPPLERRVRTAKRGA